MGEGDQSSIGTAVLLGQLVRNMENIHAVVMFLRRVQSFPL